MQVIPIALFAYARPRHLERTLDALRANPIPLLYVFSDAPATVEREPAVAEVRRILRGIDWCETVLVEREENLGLGRSILTGVSEVLSAHEAVIVFEDDLVCAPGSYAYLCAAMRQYWENPKVMSVTGWTHPKITPGDVTDQPYFDGRAECLMWGTWARVWAGMDKDALTLMNECAARGIDPNRYGYDLPVMAESERRLNIWAVRFLYLHILNQGLCFRPPWTLVEHIGFDEQATNATDGSMWANPPLKPCPPQPETWLPAVENPQCAALWQAAFPPAKKHIRGLLKRAAGRMLRALRA